MKKQRAVRWAEPDSEQKSGIKLVRDLLGNVSFPFLFLLFALVAVLKSIVIHQHLVNLTGNHACFFGYVLRHDALFCAFLLAAWLLHGMGFMKRGGRTILKVAFLSVLLLYLLDVAVLANFHTHLFYLDLVKYLGSAPGFLWSACRNLLPVWAVIGTACLLTVGVGFVLVFLIHDQTSEKSTQRIVLALLLFSLGIYALPDTKHFVHAWVYNNVLEYNFSMWSQNRDYSEDFRRAFHPVEAVTHEDCVPGVANRNNILLVIFESLSMYHSKRFSGLNDWVPHFDSIAEEHVKFTNFYANGFNTEEGLIALFTGRLPLSPPDAAINGGVVTFEGFFGRENALPDILEAQGYTTEFLTTCDLRFSNKGAWLKSIGFGTIEGHEHPFYTGFKRFHFDAAPDEALYARALDRLYSEKRTKPVFLVLETVSTHHPFVDPVSGDASEEGAFRYADAQLKKFYDALEEKGFFRDGILLITSDHRSMTPLSREEVNLYGLERAPARVPFVLVDTDLGRRVVTGPFQLTDIYNTLVNYARPRKCTSVWKGDFLLPEPVSPRFLIHKSGYQRNVVHVYEGKRNFSIKMSGDQTAVVSGGDGDDPVSRLLVNKVNYERMLLSGGKE